jgi:hypothetical protein
VYKAVDLLHPMHPKVVLLRPLERSCVRLHGIAC